MMHEVIEEPVTKSEYTGNVEGLRSIGLAAAKELLHGKNFDDVFSCFVQSTVENLIERVVDPFVTFSRTEAEQRIEPVAVPKGSFNVSDQLMCLPLTGIVDIGEGTISNLSALTKSDDCIVDVQGRVLFVRLKFLIANVAYTADSKLGLFCSNSAFNLKGLLSSVSLNVEICVDFRSLSNLSAEISKFDFNLGEFNVGVQGDTIPQLLAATIKHYFKAKYQDDLKDLSVEKVKEVMESAARKLVPLLNQCVP